MITPKMVSTDGTNTPPNVPNFWALAIEFTFYEKAMCYKNMFFPSRKAISSVIGCYFIMINL
jgi:hypothetical protein